MTSSKADETLSTKTIFTAYQKTHKAGEQPMSQHRGPVRWFNNVKGYGFLGRDGGPDVFVHYTSIQSEGYKTLHEGEIVEYDIIQGDKGPQADNVTKKPVH
jgi:cold shock protein